MKTGVSGATALISSSVGNRFSSNWCSVKPPTTRTHWGGGVTAICRFSISIASASERTPSQRSSMLKLSPARMMCRWLSIKPGRTRRPPRSITRVAGPARGMTSASVPTRRNLPSRIATAVALGFERSRVVTVPLCKMRSVDVLGMFIAVPPAILAPRRLLGDVVVVGGLRHVQPALELGFDQAVFHGDSGHRVGAERQAQRGLVAVDQLEQRLGQLLRVTWLPMVC